jgi:hypothetical protein
MRALYSVREPRLSGQGKKYWFYAHQKEFDTSTYNKKNNYLQNTESNLFFLFLFLSLKRKRKKSQPPSTQTPLPPLLHTGSHCAVTRSNPKTGNCRAAPP